MSLSSSAVELKLTNDAGTWYALAREVDDMLLTSSQAPETIARDENGRWKEWDTKADIWSLGTLSCVRLIQETYLLAGMILHKMLFFKLPYGETENYEELSARIRGYPGYVYSYCCSSARLMFQ